jgi:hypothetical protein
MDYALIHDLPWVCNAGPAAARICAEVAAGLDGFHHILNDFARRERLMIGKRRAFTYFSALAVFSLFITSAHAATIAHWSFDTSTLSTDGTGNIVGASDATGNHNATIGMGVGSANGTTQGGPQFDSNPIPGSNSIAGKFAQGLTLTGFNNNDGGRGQFLEFPNLTELMTANSAPGSPSYTVSYWINTTTTNAQQFTVLADWGNAATNPGRFTYGYGFQFTSGVARMRGQARFNTSGTGNGTDIYARANVNNPTLNDGTWHMLTWTFDTTAGVLKSYFDGNLVDTFQSTAANFNMIASSSPVGTFGLKGDSGNFINGTIALDEAWVFTDLLSDGAVRSLYNNNLIPEPVSALLGIVGLAFCAMLRRRK